MEVLMMFAAWLLPRFFWQALRLPVKECVGVLEAATFGQEMGVGGGKPAACSTGGEGRGEASQRLAPRGVEVAGLVGVSEAAEQAGVRVGMTVSQAQARCGRLRVVYRDEAAEGVLQAWLLGCAEGWTPDYEATRPGLCVLDLTQARWRDELSWVERGMMMREEVAAQGCEVRVGLADKADLAVLAAHVAEPVRVLRAGVAEERRALDALPMEVLTGNGELLRLLGLWGVRSLGQFVGLPRGEVVRRLGAEGLALHDLARGGRERLLRLVRPPVRFEEVVELEAGIECLEPLMRVLGGMVGRLCGRLAEAWRVAGVMRVRFGFDDRTEHERELRVAEPTREEAVLLRLLETYLEGVKASAAVVRVGLEILPVRAASRQGLLFDQGLRDPNRFAETLSALEAILGRGRVGRVERLPSRRVDAFRVVPFLEAGGKVVGGGDERGLGLPLLRYRPERGVRVVLRDRRLVGLVVGGESKGVKAVEGPWFLSGEWWDAGQAWERAIWEVEEEGGGVVRVVREGGRWGVSGEW
jgi:protein ImuB